MDRAMGGVADRAVLTNRGVLPQERPALLGVAGVAGFVDRALDEQPGAGRSVGIVAVAAGDLPLADRMRRRPEDLRPLLPVAGQTRVGLCRLGQHGISPGMHGVAGGAGQTMELVRAAPPVHARAPFVT